MSHPPCRRHQVAQFTFSGCHPRICTILSSSSVSRCIATAYSIVFSTIILSRSTATARFRFHRPPHHPFADNAVSLHSLYKNLDVIDFHC
jgi:hypothetical protein